MFDVAIIMSTFNGEKYISEQIKSIFSQNDVNITLFIRDDGSHDKTISIINELAKKYNIVLLKNSNNNLGPAKSFMKIIDNISDSFDYYAFSDQDDIWEKNKIINAINSINRYDAVPAIYGSNYKLLYDSGLIINSNNDISTDFYSTIIRNKIAGCTMVFNKKLFLKIKKYTPDYIEMHDIWIWKVCQAIDGKCIYDTESYIYYRQHENNVMGAGNTIKSKMKYRLRRKNVCSNTAIEILKGYGDEICNEEKKEVIKQLSLYKKNIRYKMRLLLNKKIKSEKIISTLLFKIGILFNYE